jgi:hypothetical protein
LDAFIAHTLLSAESQKSFVFISFFSQYAIYGPMSQNKPKRCPVCKKPVELADNTWQPFCSKRCKTIDLGEWATESYRIPGQKVEEGQFEKDDEQNSDSLVKLRGDDG